MNGQTGGQTGGQTDRQMDADQKYYLPTTLPIKQYYSKVTKSATPSFLLLDNVTILLLIEWSST